MTRPQVQVRPAAPTDAPALVRLWTEVLDEAGPVGRTSDPPTVEAVESRLASLDGDSSRVLLVAVQEDEPVAVAHLVSESLTPMHDTCATRMSYFHVVRRYRRRGVGTALLAGAAAWAEQAGAEHVVADCNPAARETNRFFARLGFGPMLVQRSVPLPVLLRRLTVPGQGVDDVAVRRASLRVRARGTVSAVHRGRVARRARPTPSLSRA